MKVKVKVGGGSSPEKRAESVKHCILWFSSGEFQLALLIIKPSLLVWINSNSWVSDLTFSTSLAGGIGRASGAGPGRSDASKKIEKLKE